MSNKEIDRTQELMDARHKAQMKLLKGITACADVAAKAAIPGNMESGSTSASYLAEALKDMMEAYK